MKQHPSLTQDIPDSFREIAATYSLTITHNWAFGSRFYVRDESINASHLQYREREFMHLTAEQLTADIEEALDNYEYEPLELPTGNPRRRSPVTGRFK